MTASPTDDNRLGEDNLQPEHNPTCEVKPITGFTPFPYARTGLGSNPKSRAILLGVIDDNAKTIQSPCRPSNGLGDGNTVSSVSERSKTMSDNNNSSKDMAAMLAAMQAMMAAMAKGQMPQATPEPEKKKEMFIPKEASVYPQSTKEGNELTGDWNGKICLKFGKYAQVAFEPSVWHSLKPFLTGVGLKPGRLSFWQLLAEVEESLVAGNPLKSASAIEELKLAPDFGLDEAIVADRHTAIHGSDEDNAEG